MIPIFTRNELHPNDFLVIDDPRGQLDLTPDAVARMCDRREGIGADGLLRLVRCTAEPEAFAMAAEADWFMDYRNADGSLSEMCGNGVRVFGRYLVEHEGVDPSRPLPVATRGGTKVLTFDGDTVSDSTVPDTMNPQDLAVCGDHVFVAGS
jgi:diaminopimelate epimerase